MSKYGFGKAVEYGFDAAVAKVTEALAKDVRGRLDRVMAALRSAVVPAQAGTHWFERSLDPRFSCGIT